MTSVGSTGDRPLEGVTVVELGMWVAGPGAGGILADWGADVVKVEPAVGDPWRRFYQAALGVDVPDSPHFDMDNRGKRSVVLDLKSEQGRDELADMLDGVDVFVSNMRLNALQHMGLMPERVLATRPRLIYGLVTGYGRRGPDADRAAYDGGAFWGRSGMARSIAPEGQPPPALRTGVGDHITAMNLVAGITAALVARGRTGRGQLVETSLLRSGLYCMSSDLMQLMRWGTVTPTSTRETFPNPIMNSYCAADGEWFALLCLEGDRHWPSVVNAIEMAGLLDDPRFVSTRARFEHAEQLVSILDQVFRTLTRSEWADRFAQHGVWWSPLNTLADVLADPQVTESGAFVDVPASGGAEAHKAIAGPVDFDSKVPIPFCGPPAIGEHGSSREGGPDAPARMALAGQPTELRPL